MATVTHYIYSHYEPEEQRKTLEKETGQTDSDATDPWLTESTFGVNRRVANPPRFVAAAVGYDQLADISRSYPHLQHDNATQLSTDDLGGWYRSLVRREEKRPMRLPEQRSKPVVSETISPTPRQATKHDKDIWFISNVLETDPENRSTSTTPAPTLADILSRDPPPLPSQQPFIPPIFLSIGPSNKGFEMLQKGGWQEGEALGRTAIRRGGIGFKGPNSPFEDEVPSTRQGRRAELVKEEKEIIIRHGEDIEEVRKVDAIDLTSDNDSDEGSIEDSEDLRLELGDSLLDPAAGRKEDEAAAHEFLIDHNPRALLTPLPTVLKSDRLGIGLKAKRIGPYGESVKRVTHSQAAVSAHVKKSEETKRLKAKVGRGRRGYERMHKKESSDRRALLSYLNAG